jgi:hypothetical protein
LIHWNYYDILFVLYRILEYLVAEIMEDMGYLMMALLLNLATFLYFIIVYIIIIINYKLTLILYISWWEIKIQLLLNI